MNFSYNVVHSDGYPEILVKKVSKVTLRRERSQDSLQTQSQKESEFRLVTLTETLVGNFMIGKSDSPEAH